MTHNMFEIAKRMNSHERRLDMYLPDTLELIEAANLFV